MTILDYPEMSDDELTSAANEVFFAYDARETGEGDMRLVERSGSSTSE